MKVRDRIVVLTDLFMGACWADDEFSEDEQKAVRQLLADLLEVTSSTLPPSVEDRIRDFEPLTFDLGATARDFEADPPQAKRRLLELVGKMVNADGVVDLAEDQYLRELAGFLGLEYDDYSDLILDFTVEELRDTFEQLRVPPPPLVTADRRPSRPPPPPIVEPDSVSVPNELPEESLSDEPAMVPRADPDPEA